MHIDPFDYTGAKAEFDTLTSFVGLYETKNKPFSISDIQRHTYAGYRLAIAVIEIGLHQGIFEEVESSTPYKYKIKQDA